MHTKNALPALLPILLAGFLIPARSEAQKSKGLHDPLKPSAEGKLESGVRLEFRVSGLTKGNLEQVRQSLTAMTVQVYACEDCKFEEAVAGKCPHCNLELKARKEPVLVDAVPSVETASIRLTSASARILRYSDLASALVKNSVQIDTAKFPLAGKSRLVLRGGTAENAAAIEKALVDSKLFDLVKAQYDAPSGELRVAVHAKETPPMHAEVTSILDALGTDAKLTDVIWGPPTTPTKIG